MDEDCVKTLLSSIVTDYKILKFEGQSDENYTLSFQCKLNGENYDDKCSNFIKTFSDKTSSNWIVEKCVRKGERYEFRKRYLCHLSSKNKALNKTIGHRRNYNCHASVSIKFLKQTQHTLKKSAMLKQGLCVLIHILYVHTHGVRVPRTYNLLRCNDDVKVSFESYFQSGMSCAEAKKFHEIELGHMNGADIVDCLANAQKNPTEAQVGYMYRKWRKERDNEREIVTIQDTHDKNLKDPKQEDVQSSSGVDIHKEDSIKQEITCETDTEADTNHGDDTADLDSDIEELETKKTTVEPVNDKSTTNVTIELKEVDTSNKNIKRKFLELERKKSERYVKYKKKNVIANEEKSEDYHYLMSLLPQMKRFTPAQKFRVRNRINDVILAEINPLENED